MREILDRLACWWLDRRASDGAAQIAAERRVTMHRMSAGPEGFRMDVLAPDLIHLIDQAAALLNAQSAENYIQFDMLPRLDRTGQRPIRVTIQWMEGESPAQQNARLRDELARLRDAVAAGRACEAFYLNRHWAMYEDEASLWMAFATAARAALPRESEAAA